MRKADIKVDLLDVMGSDLTVVNAARVSMDKFHDDYEDETDTGLIKYLAKHNHWSPFSHPQLSFRVKAPIFVARQLIKHHVGVAWNEVSRRYVDSEPEFYIPALRQRAPSVKQGSLANEIEFADVMQHKLETQIEDALHTYNAMLHYGVAPEVARAALPLCAMTEWVWTGSLCAFMRVINLRIDAHAQAESRIVAKMIAMHVEEYFPVSFEALLNGYI